MMLASGMKQASIMMSGNLLYFVVNQVSLFDIDLKYRLFRFSTFHKLVINLGMPLKNTNKHMWPRSH